MEDSLKRLQTDHIDLYQSHTDDKDAPLEETLAAYDQLIKQGKVRAIGASNYDAPRLAEALGVSAAKKLPRYETLQPHYNLYERADYERALEPLVLKESIGVIPYYSLASGFLTGKYRSEADFKKSPRGGGMKIQAERARPAHPQGPGRRLSPPESQPGPGGSRLADRAPQHHRPHRQRHQHEPAQRPDRRRPPQARRRRHQGARCGERLTSSETPSSWRGCSVTAIQSASPRMSRWRMYWMPATRRGHDECLRR